jgi:hypothetical protein
MDAPEIGELSEAICRVAHGGECGSAPIEEFSFDVLKQLQSLGMIERGLQGEPLLTTRGRRTCSLIEAGRSVPEFDDEPI